MNEEGLFGVMFLTLSPFTMLLAHSRNNVMLMLFTVIWTIWWALLCVDDWFFHSELIIWLLGAEDSEYPSNADKEASP